MKLQLQKVTRILSQPFRSVAAVTSRFGVRVDAAIHRFVVAIETALRDAVQAIKRDYHSVILGIKQFRSSVATGISKAFQGAIHGMRHALYGGLHGIKHAGESIWLGIIHRAQASLHSATGISSGFIDLFRQVGGDFRHLVWYLSHRGLRAVLSVLGGMLKALLLVTAPLRKALHPLIATIVRPFARHARDEALGMSTTPDHRSHWELLALSGFAIVVTIGLLAYSGLLHLSSNHFVMPKISPHYVFTRLATYSPVHLTALAAAALVVIFTLWFWLHMLRDSYVRAFSTQTEKMKWRIVTTLFFVPGGVYYFFKVYNHWTFRQFLMYHLVSVMITGVAVLITTSTSGALYYFNQKANAQSKTHDYYKVPNLALDAKSQEALLGRTQYGAPLSPNTAGGRIDPFAPIPGQATASPLPSLTGSPSPTPSPSPSPSPLVR